MPKLIIKSHLLLAGPSADLLAAMEGVMNGSFRRMISFLCMFVLAVGLLGVGSAAAQTMYSVVTIQNTTSAPVTLSSINLSGLWDNQNGAIKGGCQGGTCTNPDGSPPTTIAGNTTILFATKSNGGLAPDGTGGSLTVNSVGTVSRSVPWCWAHGCGQCGASANSFEGFDMITGGQNSSAGATSCTFSFGITTGNIVAPTTQSFQNLYADAQNVFVVGTNRDLWLEQAPFGTVPPARERIDGNVLTAQPFDINDVFVLGNDRNLWLERAPFGNVPPARQQIDGGVEISQAIDLQHVFVLGIDRNLWLEQAPFGTVPPPGRQQVDGSVQNFQAIGVDQVFVLGKDGNLWLEQAPFGNVPPSRQLIDSSVQAFQGLKTTEAVFVLSTDGKLWLDQYASGSNNVTHTQVDADVRAVKAMVLSDFVWVLGSNGNLWLEQGPFGNVPPARQQIDAGVSDFQPVDISTVLVLGSDGNLWLEHAPFGTIPPARRQVDANVALQ
jgi:hypothetical protein